METSSLTFAQPGWFFALALVPVLAGLFVWAQIRSDAMIARVVAPRLREQLAGAVSRGLRVLRATLVLLAFAAAVVAMARPQWGYTEREITQRGRDIILAVDTSRSMLATDVVPNRLARAKLFAKDLLRLAEGDRVGVVAFAGSAFLQAPLTLDRNAALGAIDELDPEIIPKGGTNIAEAIRLSMQAFGKGEGQTRALVILTDGEELDADGIAAARKAREAGVAIFTVGIGSEEGSLIPVRDDDGRQDFVRDPAGNKVTSRLDASRLREIAEAGGGFYEPLGTDTASVIFQKGILPLETAERGTMASRQPIERYQWPLGLALGLLALWQLIGERRIFRKRATVAASVFLGILSFTPHAQAASGVESYEQGNFDQAYADFQNRLEKSPDSAKLKFNAGAAAYKLNNFPEAVDLFAKALAAESPDPKLKTSATYNLANSLVRRGEAAEKPEDKKSDWKNAIGHYETVLKDEPQNQQAAENLEIVKKMLEDLEKQEEQKKQDQQQQDQQQQNQQQQNQQQQDQQQQDQQQQDQQQQDQQQQDQQQQDQQQQDQQQQDQQQQDQQQQDQQQQDQQQQDQQQQDQQQQDQQQQNQQQQNQQQQNQQQQNQQESGEEEAKNQESQDSGSENRQQQGGERDQRPAPAPTPGEKKEGEIRPADQQQEEGERREEEMMAAAESSEEEGQMSEGQARALLNSLRADEDRVPLMRQSQMPEDTLRDW